MVQNRNKLLYLFIGNLTNAVVHAILEGAADDEGLSRRYEKESATSFNTAKKYREKINPALDVLPEKDVDYIKARVMNRVTAELQSRIAKGYKGIDLWKIEQFVDKKLEELNVL
jgi:hypothetical protein